MNDQNPILVTEQDQQFYDENGFWISPKIFDDAQIERMKEAQERIWSKDYDGDGFPLTEWESNGDPTQLRKIDNAWWINDEIQSAVTDPRLGQITADLLGTNEVRLWYDQIIHKPGSLQEKPNVTANVGWHQDYVYWQCTNSTNFVTAWIALQDTDLSNGCMKAIKGSHKWGLNPSSGGFFDNDLDALKDKYSQGDQEWEEIPLILKAGQASFHHALTFHGSGPNLSASPRLSVVSHLMPQGMAYKNHGSNVDNIRLLGARPKEGQLYVNEYFPLLYSK